MIESVNKYDFQDAFRRVGRNDQFSYDGQRALFDYLEEYEEDTGEQIELDVIALCCDFSEHDSALDCINDLGYTEFEVDPAQDEDETEEAALDYLRYNTTVITFDTGIIIQGF